ncbi:MAG: energy transducer TonB [Planctomycetota bacterium]
MPSLVKSYAVSLATHGTIVALLYAIPVSTRTPFSSAGSDQVITIELDRSVANTMPTPRITASPEGLLQNTLPRAEGSDLAMAGDRMLPGNHARSPSRGANPLTPDAGHELPPLTRSALQLTRVPMSPDRVPVETPTEFRPRLTPRPAAPAVTPMTPPTESAGLQDQSADLSNNQPPTYPAEAVRRKLEGVVMLRLSINERGTVTDVQVSQSCGHLLLDQAAVQAVRQWQGRPARRWGRAVASSEVLPIRFRL